MRLASFALWLAVAVFLAVHHTFWRDEVRALSIALQGNTVFAMLASLRGEGHPALWYLLLRGAHTIVPRPEVLPVVAFLIAAAASLVLVLRSPFHWSVLALILATSMMTFEYTVMARNYGISMLLLFVLAACYERFRTRGIVLGVLLALLANTNVHSVLLAAAFLLFWLIDLAREQGLRWSPHLRTFALNATLTVAGIALCFVTVYPTYNGAAENATPLGAAALFTAIFKPVVPFITIVQTRGWLHWAGPFAGRLLSLVLAGSTLVLVRRPAAFVAALAALFTFSLLFTFVYGASYRHAALLLVFLIALWWIVAERNEPRVPSPLVRQLGALGAVLTIALLALQIPRSVDIVASTVRGGPPFSRSRDAGALVARRPDLHDAVVIADPDYLVEALPYYIPNPTYLMREQRFGRYVRFTRRARLRIGLDDILHDARSLQRSTGKPVVILLAVWLAPGQRSMQLAEGYDWTLDVTPAGVTNFLGATTLVARLRPAAGDESYDVYTLDR